ncbi:MAG: alpha-1,2-fucosyltransferase [Eubacterium sp.]|nr:alpha-1,2-fucosyltransferase [Eubacterium sp.]
MKIVKVKGGLGNQLFQYSYACLLRHLSYDDVKIDMTAFEDIINDSIRKPRLLKMKISLQTAEDNEINSICFFKHKGNPLNQRYRLKIYLEKLLNRKYFLERTRAYIDPCDIIEHQYFDGYWQSWRYVDTVWRELKDQFVPNYELHKSTQKMIDEVSNVNSVFIGIRRGDYSAEERHYGSFGNEYYQKAMDYITGRVDSPVFYVFSNDIPWVKENIDFRNRNVVFREPDDVVDDFEDLFIMAACRHSIIINSTYHWWGARLNEYDGKIVVAPQKWFFDDKPIDIVPPKWVRI